jgi:hypothetical protein
MMFVKSQATPLAVVIYVGEPTGHASIRSIYKSGVRAIH